MDSRENVFGPKPAAPDFRLAYGKAPKQFGDLRVPPGAGKHPVAIVLHGGFWRSQFNLEYMGHLSISLKQAGIATWNLEYRGIGDPGGGWPGTFDDVAAGAAFLTQFAETHRLDLSRVVTLGHSAGGQLALWLASMKKPLLKGCVSLGGVADLKRAYELRLSNTVVADLLGGSPNEVPDRYKATDPMELLPVAIPQTLFAGTEDSTVPMEIAERYARAAHARLIVLKCGHFEPVDPSTPQWASVKAEISRMLSVSSSSVV